MDDLLNIPKDEWGRVRVFALNIDAAEVRRWTGGEAVKDGTAARVLGVPHLDPDKVEVVPLEPLKAIGFTAFLTDGMGLDEAAVRADRARLDALAGHALILSSGALGTAGGNLSPGPEVTPIGVYGLPPAESSFEKLTADAARGTLGAGEAPDAGPPSRSLDARAIGLLVLVALLLGAVLLAVIG